MPNASLTISTIVDGKERMISQKGEIYDSGDKLEIRYIDGEAETQITVQKDCATIIRSGDYGMSLSLKRGANTQGELLIGGNIGKMEVITHLAEYSLKSDKYLITLRYDILFNGDPQKMHVRILAKVNG